MTQFKRAILMMIASASMIAIIGCEKSSPPAPDQPASEQSSAPPVAPATPSAQPPAPEKIEQSLSAAQEYITSADFAKAEAILIKLIERAPQELRGRELYGQVLGLQADAAQKRGDSLAATKLRTRAYEQYQAAVTIDPKSAGLQHSAGLMAMAAGLPEEALAHFEAAAKLDPTNSQFALFAAQLLIQQQRYDEARAFLETVLKADPNEAMAHASLAIIDMEQGQFENALVHVRQARQIDPNDVNIRVQEAKILRRNGQVKTALELMVGLSAAERSKEPVAFEIAACYEQLGDLMNAARAWQHAVQTNPLDPRAWLFRVRAAQFLLKAGEREQAWMWLQEAKLAAPNAPEVKELEAAFSK
jgi:tetratricopeptide (TPR) repeat protein